MRPPSTNTSPAAVVSTVGYQRKNAKSCVAALNAGNLKAVAAAIKAVM